MLSAGRASVAQISDSNKATRAIQLFGAFVEEDFDGAAGRKNAFTLVTPQRTYKFAAGDRADAEAWVAALRDGIQKGSEQHAEVQRTRSSGGGGVSGTAGTGLEDSVAKMGV